MNLVKKTLYLKRDGLSRFYKVVDRNKNIRSTSLYWAQNSTSEVVMIPTNVGKALYGLMEIFAEIDLSEK